VAITVRFPAMLHARTGVQMVIADEVRDLPSLITALDRRVPGLAADLADPMFNIAVNDEMLLHSVAARSLSDGDVVEFVPTIAGG
jgi:molybdopterin converting factor small subunit